jgi:hypothetical protein
MSASELEALRSQVQEMGARQFAAERLLCLTMALLDRAQSGSLQEIEGVLADNDFIAGTQAGWPATRLRQLIEQARGLRTGLQG